MNDLLFTFILLNIVNVMLQTAKSLFTIKGNKVVAALANAVAYGLYTIVIVYTMCDLPLLTKALVVAACNMIGVYTVKAIEEKMRKDKLWKIEATIPCAFENYVEMKLTDEDIPFSILSLNDKYFLLFAYASTSAQSDYVHKCIDECSAKYFVSESKKL